MKNWGEWAQFLWSLIMMLLDWKLSMNFSLHTEKKSRSWDLKLISRHHKIPNYDLTMFFLWIKIHILMINWKSNQRNLILSWKTITITIWNKWRIFMRIYKKKEVKTINGIKSYKYKNQDIVNRYKTISNKLLSWIEN